MPADLALTTFGDIAEANAFGSLGDLRLVPDGASALLPAIAGRPETELILASIREPDGRAWDCDPRTALAEAVGDLAAAGLHLQAAFEQEFTLLGPGRSVGPGAPGEPAAAPFSLEAHRLAEPFGTELVTALAAAGLAPETWLPEYGSGQFEITIAPAAPLEAADRAILVRALARDIASGHGLRASFAPLLRPDAVGNGVHVHLSLRDAAGRPVTLDPAGAPTDVAARFVAGILDHAAALVGWTAPSAISSIRLQPHRWSSAAAFLGRQNREAMVRICPVPTLDGGDPLPRANLEYRAADATANPWLVLAALIRAGLDGIERRLAPAAVVEDELEALGEADRQRLGVRSLPADLPAALAALEGDATAAAWFGPRLLDTHLAVRRTELAILADATLEDRCRRYADVL